MNILFITRLYPSDCYDNQQTGMGHYICREWVKAGHSVQVIHEDMRFNKRWSPVERALADTRRFTLEDVPVSFIKINRPFPGWRYLPGSEAKKAERFICEEVKRWGKKPDVIFAFFCCATISILWSTFEITSVRFTRVNSISSVPNSI